VPSDTAADVGRRRPDVEAGVGRVEHAGLNWRAPQRAVVPRESDSPEREGTASTGSEDGHRSVVDPSLSGAASVASDAVDAGLYLTLVGTCRVSYSGRAASELGPGRRHVTVKPDGTTLVHAAEGHRPANWQAAGASVDVSPDEDCAEPTLALVATRSNPDERLAVRFSNVRQVVAVPVEGADTPDTVGTEADLKRHVLEHPEVVERGLQPLATERETPAGPVDVYAEDRDGTPVVIELKRTRVGPDAVGQLSRYVDALGRDLHADADPRGVLVAPSVTDRARRLLAEAGLGFASVDPPTE